jgi:hypothetical protein
MLDYLVSIRGGDDYPVNRLNPVKGFAVKL